MMSRTAIFQRIPLLSDLPREERDFLASVLKEILLKSDEILFQEGDSGDCLYAILDGSVDVILGHEAKREQILASLGAGEFIGEMSLLIPGRRRTATVRAHQPTRLWQMTREDFISLMQRQPSLAVTMIQTLTKRLEATNTASYRDLQEKNASLQRAYDALQEVQSQLVEKERLEQELRVAAEIQTSILPGQLPEVEGYSFGAIMHPARIVGGDFFDIFSLRNGMIGFVVGDVADKGVPSAIFMARTHAFIMAESAHGGSCGDILRRANKHLVQMGQADLFVTVLFGILDPQSGRFTYARAGHELPLLLTASGEVTPFPQERGQPLGILEDFLLDEQEFNLQNGCCLLIFSDGLTDCRNPGGDPFGHERVSELMKGLKQTRGQYVCESLQMALGDFQDGSLQDDDVTIVAIAREMGRKDRQVGKKRSE